MNPEALETPESINFARITLVQNGIVTVFTLLTREHDEVKPIKDKTAPSSLSFLLTSRKTSGTRKDYIGSDSVVENVS